MDNRMMAHIGLCAAVAVLVASLGILIFQGSPTNGSVTIPAAMQPAQLTTPVHGTNVGEANHIRNADAAHADSASANL